MTAGTTSSVAPLSIATSTGGTRWSGLETSGMKDARCSLLLQEEETFDSKIKALPSQRVMVYQDKGFNPAASSSDLENYFVNFQGATILQLEPQLQASHMNATNSGGARSGTVTSTMPVTMTLGGRCVLTPENYQDFRVMMRTKTQSQEMNIAPNGNFDWPDVSALLCCPVCGRKAPIPQPGERVPHEYWMVFYPLLQITVLKGSQLTLGTRTICRMTCLECMDDLLEGLTLTIQPGKTKTASNNSGLRSTRLCFTLPALDVLAEAGSASFLEDGPPRPDTHPHVDDILDAWTLYNLWEHSGAWEALQNDYRLVLSRSMQADSRANSTNGAPHAADVRPNSRRISSESPPPTFGREKVATVTPESRLKERMGKPCGNRACSKVHGQRDAQDGEIVRLAIKCRDCLGEFYCSKSCRAVYKSLHAEECVRKQKDREERRQRKAKKVECDTCRAKFPYTKMKKCSRCRQVTYCSVECQKSDWNNRHRFQCQSTAR
jgi:hypothetical protein